MFENRVPHMLDDEYVPAKSQLNIFVKDLGIVLGEAMQLTFPCPLAAAAHQQLQRLIADGTKFVHTGTGFRPPPPHPNVKKTIESVSGLCTQLAPW